MGMLAILAMRPKQFVYILALLTLHVMIEMHFLLQKNLKNIMHGRVKLLVMR